MDVPPPGLPFSSQGLPQGSSQGRPPYAALLKRDSPLDALKARWRTASLAAGWRFPSDWALPEVDIVCAEILRGADAEIPLAELARARAAAGVCLAETLADLAALHAVLGDPTADGLVSPDIDAAPARLLRITAIAWADVALERLTSLEITDPLTGLPTAGYLATRMGEVYRESRINDPSGVANRYVLLVISMDLSEVAGLPRLTSMILLADAARMVFCQGESIATLGPSVIAVLAPRTDQLFTQIPRLRQEVDVRLTLDPQLYDTLHKQDQPQIRFVRLPPNYQAATALLARLGRS